LENLAVNLKFVLKAVFPAIIGFFFWLPSLIAQTGWQQLPNTQLQSVCPPNGFGLEVSDNQPYPFSANCHSVFDAWSGGIADTTRNRLLIWGGGHVDYGGNELYSLNLTANPVTLTRLTDPSLPVYDSNALPCPTTLSNGRPNIRHTTNSLAYMASVDRMFAFGGGVACGNGYHYDDTWTLNLSAINNTGLSGWLAMDPVAQCTGCLNMYVNPANGPADDYWWSVVDYDPNTQNVFMFHSTMLIQYNYTTNSYKNLANLAVPTEMVGAGGVIDPKRKLFIIMGNDSWVPGSSSVHHLGVIDISGNDPTYAYQDWTSQVTGCDALTTAIYPGLAYDSVADRTVGWPSGGNDVYLFNPDTKSCQVQSYPNGPVGPPSGATTDGIFGRFRYFPGLNEFAVVPNTNQNAYLLQLALPNTSDTQAPTTPANLAAVAATAAQVNLTWTASTDNVGVVGYYIFRGGAHVATSVNASYSDTGLTAGTAYTYNVAAIDAAGNLSNWSAAVTVGNSTSAGNPTNPTAAPFTVSLSTPISGSSLANSVTVSAVATDIVAIASVQFQLDGSNLGAPDTTAPYSYTWDTTTAANGAHTLTAIATDVAGNTATSAGVSVTVSNTAAPVNTTPPLLLLHADATEVSGVTNGSKVTPTIGPSGFTGTVSANGAGSVNFASAATANGVYFLNCCANTNNAYYKFTGAAVGNIFNTNQGQISFYLKSRYSFALRTANAASSRYTFDVRDGNGTHLFNFITQVVSGRLVFNYLAAGSGTYYYAPSGTEDALYGNGVILQVTLSWSSAGVNLYLNNTLVKSTAYTAPSPSWTATSNFDLGAFEYLTFGGYNVSDDVIDEFTVQATAATGVTSGTTSLSASITSPTSGATISGTTTISATAPGAASVQFALDGANLGSAVTGAGPSYSYSWNTTTATNGAHTLTAVATGASANTLASASVPVVVSNTQTVLTATSGPNGLGASTYTCLDRDGDGYGVGPGCLGPDADDTDPTVHSGAQALAKYGTLSAFLTHLGYTPQHIWYLAPATATPPGNDATGVRDDVTHPYLTYATINGHVAAGDMIMLRNNWNGRITPPNGVQGSPVVMMSYPGEQAVFDASDAQSETIVVLGISWWVVDGIKFQNEACMSGGTADANTASIFHDIFIRHVDAGGGGCGLGGFSAFNGLVNLTIEDSVFHDNDCAGGACQHGVYLGSRGLPSSNVTIHRSIAFGNDYNGFTFNGRCTNCVFDQLLSYNNGIAGLTLEMGVSNSFARSNVLFNNAGGQFVIFNYPGDCASQGGVGVPPICPYDQTGNLFENNTIYQTGNDKFAGGTTGGGCPAGIQDCGQPAIVINNTTNPLTGNLGGNTFRNNIVVNYGYSNHYPPIIFEDNQGGVAACGSACQSWLATSTFNGVVAFQADGNNGSGVIGAGAGSTGFGYKPYTCAQASAITSISNCIDGNPKFVAASPADWNSIGTFNFQLQQSSPAYHAGTSVGIPAYDIIGNVFASTPSMGAYELVAASTSQPVTSSAASACDLNGDGVVNAADVQIAINQTLGIAVCGSAALQQAGVCNVVDVQRVINASLGGACLTGQ
jgi:chitodextrinase